jgi:RNA polymerase sigma-70 factor (ECF subfamily)
MATSGSFTKTSMFFCRDAGVWSPRIEEKRILCLAKASNGDQWVALRMADRNDAGGGLLRCLGRDDVARAAYRGALELATSPPERRFLSRRLEQF